MDRELLKDIVSRLERIEERLDTIQKDCSSMSSHISFVEKTYNAVKFPLEYLKNKVELLAGSERTPLPVIKNSCTR
jgi:archaellum component FlaC